MSQLYASSANLSNESYPLSLGVLMFHWSKLRHLNKQKKDTYSNRQTIDDMNKKAAKVKNKTLKDPEHWNQDYFKRL